MTDTYKKEEIKSLVSLVAANETGSLRCTIPSEIVQAKGWKRGDNIVFKFDPKKPEKEQVTLYKVEL